MSIRDQIKAASAAARKSQTVSLPVAKVDVLVIGMMAGDRLRVVGDDGKIQPTRSIPLMIALTAHDPATRQPLWNPNDLNDMQEIAGLTGEDADVLTDAALRTSGLEKDAGKASAGSGSSSSSSAPASAARQLSSGS